MTQFMHLRQTMQTSNILYLLKIVVLLYTLKKWISTSSYMIWGLTNLGILFKTKNKCSKKCYSLCPSL